METLSVFAYHVIEQEPDVILHVIMYIVDAPVKGGSLVSLVSVDPTLQYRVGYRPPYWVLRFRSYLTKKCVPV